VQLGRDPALGLLPNRDDVLSRGDVVARLDFDLTNEIKYLSQLLRRHPKVVAGTHARNRKRVQSAGQQTVAIGGRAAESRK
jgi:hypothetical protein